MVKVPEFDLPEVDPQVLNDVNSKIPLSFFYLEAVMDRDLWAFWLELLDNSTILAVIAEDSSNPGDYYGLKYLVNDYFIIYTASDAGADPDAFTWPTQYIEKYGARPPDEVVMLEKAIWGTVHDSINDYMKDFTKRYLYYDGIAHIGRPEVGQVAAQDSYQIKPPGQFVVYASSYPVSLKEFFKVYRAPIQKIYEMNGGEVVTKRISGLQPEESFQDRMWPSELDGTLIHGDYLGDLFVYVPHSYVADEQYTKFLWDYLRREKITTDEKIPLLLMLKMEFFDDEAGAAWENIWSRTLDDLPVIGDALIRMVEGGLTNAFKVKDMTRFMFPLIPGFERYHGKWLTWNSYRRIGQQMTRKIGGMSVGMFIKSDYEEFISSMINADLIGEKDGI